MPAHLDLAILGRAQVIGVVDHPGRQPQQPPFKSIKGRKIGSGHGSTFCALRNQDRMAGLLTATNLGLETAAD